MGQEQTSGVTVSTSALGQQADMRVAPASILRGDTSSEGRHQKKPA